MTRQLTTEWEHLTVREIKEGQFLKRSGGFIVGAEVSALQGPKGDKGDPGDAGPAGADGATGPQGEAGPQGVKGDTGDAGPAGQNGANGQQGIQGPAGPNLTTSAFGYTTGAGGVVTQATSKATGVTLNKLSGQITTHNAALAAGAEVSFTVTNNQVAATDVPCIAWASGGTAGVYAVDVTAVGSGSFRITISNLHTASLSEAIVINFVIVKGASS
jgi:hypothetical protein